MNQLIVKKEFLLIVLITVLFVSCDQTRVFDENKEIPKHEWFQEQPVTLTAEIKDTSAAYNVYINVRNAGYYRFSNLYLFVNTQFPDGKIQRDTAECILASPDGKWLGDGLGDIWDNRILFKEHVYFRQPGFYSFELIQAMRIDPLQGIMDAGLRIEYAGIEK